jgi:hypothetical protein
MINDYHNYTHQAAPRPMFGDFRDVIDAANNHLKDLQRTGKNVLLFQSLVLLLPDPNNLALWESDYLLDTVRKHLCEQNEDGTYRYATIPVVAAGVAAQYASTGKEFIAVAGFYATGYRSKIRDDLFYWNHFNTKLRKYKFSLRWLWHRIDEGKRNDIRAGAKSCLKDTIRASSSSDSR